MSTAITETTDNTELENYQWAWEFGRRGDDYNDFYPSCMEVWKASREKLTPAIKNSLDGLSGGPDFRSSEFYDRLHNEFGLNYPENPNLPGEFVPSLLWDFSVCLPGILVDVEDPDPQHHIKIFVDLRLPREYQVEAFDSFLSSKGCAEAVKKRQPDKFRDYLDCYDMRKHLWEKLGREPSNFEIASTVWPNLVNGEMTDKGLADKARYPLKMADYYINGKGYFEILRWRAPAKK